MKIVDYRACAKCDGFRPISHAGDGKCSRCHGTGITRKLGRPKNKIKCSRCHGTGRCQNCKGYGIII